MNKFKAGDLVYYPTMGTQVFQLDACRGRDCLPICIRFDGDEGCFEAFTSTGLVYSTDQLPKIFHATEENHALLEKLYGVKFEAPLVKPTSKDIIRAIHKSGIAYVPCWVSDFDEHPTRENVWVFVQFANDEFYLDDDGTRWDYATPFDHTTGKEITEMPE